jgi:hypothetical protein
MALTVGTDSYVTLTDANTYFTNRLYSDEWSAATDGDKEIALKMATRKIDMQPIIGRKASIDQTLQFPRLLYSDAKQPYGNTVQERLKGTAGLYNLPGWIAEDGVSQDVKDAQCEEAFAILKNGSTANKRAELQRQGVTSFSLGSLSETYSLSSVPFRLLSLEASMMLARYFGGSRVIV